MRQPVLQLYTKRPVFRRWRCLFAPAAVRHIGRNTVQRLSFHVIITVQSSTTVCLFVWSCDCVSMTCVISGVHDNIKRKCITTARSLQLCVIKGQHADKCNARHLCCQNECTTSPLKIPPGALSSALWSCPYKSRKRVLLLRKMSWYRSNKATQQ